MQSWQKNSWRKFVVKYAPDYPDGHELSAVEKTLGAFPPLVFAGEVRSLKETLANVAEGQGFLLQGGDCAESFSEFDADAIRDTFRVILQMAAILTYGTKLPVIRMGRIAGQFAKPRSQSYEVKHDEKLPSYMGDIINGIEFDSKNRTPDPTRMLKAYSQAASTLNLLRAFADGGYANLKHVHSWNMGFVKSDPQGDRYRHLADQIQENLQFMEAMGIDSSNTPQLRKVDFYTSHEALLLPFEEALTRQDSTSGLTYDTSAHFVWIGDRTRFADSAHVEFCRGIENPIGIKCGPSIDPDELIRLLDILNPDDSAGRITLITRFGYEKIDSILPRLIKRIESEGRTVVWSCDPMHGNTIKSSRGLKTRPFEHVLTEVKHNIRIHHAEGTHAGGIHLEMTGQDVTECTGGIADISDEDLTNRYRTHCDPRLNATQAIELAFLASEELSRSNNGDLW
ncbi:MAG: 3-deoxy-7-phosphoheptulonate synthase class II [Candidatus Marinimicrobia bacterium]|nr:3-deoxy-7-phosphoheptulonate synthase class II [Candidatus Neomarinimicrobiota bacterium]MBL7059847.1 3-deoxy-7-phosphoheptulonate synthase class II [Candidatus Neomarinimicrobiota bacterium]